MSFNVINYFSGDIRVYLFLSIETDQILSPGEEISGVTSSHSGSDDR